MIETGAIEDQRFLLLLSLFFKLKKGAGGETRKQKWTLSMSGCHKMCQAAVSVYDCASWNE